MNNRANKTARERDNNKVEKTTTRAYLTTHHKVVRVGDTRVLLVEHRVEGTRVGRKAVELIKVGVVLFGNNLAERTFVFGRQILPLQQRAKIARKK